MTKLQACRLSSVLPYPELEIYSICLHGLRKNADFNKWLFDSWIEAEVLGRTTKYQTTECSVEAGQLAILGFEWTQHGVQSQPSCENMDLKQWINDFFISSLKVCSILSIFSKYTVLF